jgi:hypothetical protein
MDYTKLLNKFIHIYNIQHNVKNSFFDGINDNEITSTNPQHEILYEYLERHKELEKENSNYVDIYKPGVPIENDNNYDVYVIIDDNKLPIYLSLSFMSLLSYGVANFKEFFGWTIIKL